MAVGTLVSARAVVRAVEEEARTLGGRVIASRGISPWIAVILSSFTTTSFASARWLYTILVSGCSVWVAWRAELSGRLVSTMTSSSFVAFIFVPAIAFVFPSRCSKCRTKLLRSTGQ